MPSQQQIISYHSHASTFLPFLLLQYQAIMSLAVGPSGPNDVYLHRLHAFLLSTTHGRQDALTEGRGGRVGDVRTGKLARMVKLFQSCYQPFILFGSGSNEHNQLLLTTLSSDENGIHDDDDGNHICDEDRDNLNGNKDEDMFVYYARKEVHELTEMLLVVPRMHCGNIIDEDIAAVDANSRESSMSAVHANGLAHRPRSLHAGGGHSALLSHGGDLFLWGWNNAGQIGRQGATTASATPFSNVVPPLANIKVEAVALGYTHTLVIEKDSGFLFGFGEDSRGQVSGHRYTRGSSAAAVSQHAPRRIPIGLPENESFNYVAAGLFHSAAITKEGREVITWGCGRFGQCVRVSETPRQNYGEGASTVGRWRPPDGCKLVQVACGRRHTVILDELGRVWTLGDNKYGQLGRESAQGETPQLVDGPLGRSGCFAIFSGWSHILALARDADCEAGKLYGWGRNDKGQLGTQLKQVHVLVPQVLKMDSDSTSSCELSILAACCGAESSHILDVNGDIYSTGWDEHGNLGIGHISHDEHRDNVFNWTATVGADVVAPPPTTRGRKIFAAGGAHLITLTV